MSIKRMILKTLCAAGAAAMAASNALAQTPPPTDEFYAGPMQITLFAGPNFTGRSVMLNAESTNLTRQNFNDQAVSIRIDRGAWEVCEHSDFRGQCVVLTQSVNNIAQVHPRLNREISSVRPVDASRPGRPGGPGGPGAGQGPRTGAWLFTGNNLTGARFDVTSDMADFSRTNFNDRANSLIVARGETWEFCEHSHFRGRCITVEGDSVANLGTMRLGNELSSARRIDGRYGGGYPGGPGWQRLTVTGGVQGSNATFFPAPQVNGQYIDRCLGTGGRDCDTVAADGVCRAAGFREAAYFSVDQARRYRTWHLGQRTNCTTGRCEALLDVLCIR
ncbi:MAG: beta/gamma crystallin family protein [Maricaulaceae bacterium]|nr:beta/gamma crystallin family protein [Maricaulaceae bacterium]